MVEQLRPVEAARRLKGRPDSVVLLDVRESYERNFVAITPSLHIPMNEVAGRLDEIPKDGELIVYCHSGVRSMMVAAYLRTRGFRLVANLSGGIDAWSVEVDPTLPRYT
jgi:rhodanese-related sulfurtransferase